MLWMRHNTQISLHEKAGQAHLEQPQTGRANPVHSLAYCILSIIS